MGLTTTGTYHLTSPGDSLVDHYCNLNSELRMPMYSNRGKQVEPGENTNRESLSLKV
jgi:hypothetical protein